MKLLIFLSAFCLLSHFTTALDCDVYSKSVNRITGSKTHKSCFEKCEATPRCISYHFDDTCIVKNVFDKIDTASDPPTEGYVMCSSNASQCYVQAEDVLSSGIPTISQKDCLESCRENPQCIKYTYANDECILLVGKIAVPDVLSAARTKYTLWKRFTCDLFSTVPMSQSTSEPVPSDTTAVPEPKETSTQSRHLVSTPEEEPFLTPPLVPIIYQQQPSGEYISVDPKVYKQHPEEFLGSTSDKQPMRKSLLLNILMSSKGLWLRANDAGKAVEGEDTSIIMTGQQPSIVINVLMMPPNNQDSHTP